MRLIKAVLFAAILLQTTTLVAAEPARRITHYTHQRWTEEGEAPAPIVAMAQGRDGYLWLATGAGLFRFDGIVFERIGAENGDEQHDQPSALLATRDGAIWTSFTRSRRFAVYRDGALKVLPAPVAPDRVVSMAEGKDGTIWALTAVFDAELLRLRDGRWRSFAAADGLPRDDALSLLVAADGGVWVSLSNSVARLAPGAERFEIVRRTPRANGMLSQDPQGRVWLSERRGSYPITGPGGRGPPPVQSPYPTDDSQIRGAPYFDRAGNLWIATRYRGLQRAAAAPHDGTLLIESLRGRDGLSSDLTSQVFEDREGNIWVGSEKGLDKLRPATLRSEPALTNPAAFGDKLLATSDGAVFIGQADAIYRTAPGGAPKRVLAGIREPQSLCEAPDGAVWIAFADRIVVWKSGQATRTLVRPDTDSIIYDCAFDAEGDFWISAAAGGLLRYRQGQWRTMFPPTQGDGFRPTTMVRDSQGRLVVQWDLRRLAWLEQPHPRFQPLELGRDATAVTLYPTSRGDILAAGAFGLARFRGDRTETVNPDRGALRGRISGLVQTPDGDTWLAYPRALVRLSGSDLEQAFASHVLAPASLSLGFGDGLTSRPHSHSQRSLVQGGDGRLWVATETGVLWMDPRRIARDGLPPGVTIKSVTAGGRLHRDPTALSLKEGTSSIEIDYAVLSFADPRQASVRYKLEGFDREWVDPGARRQAFYTNLKPGKYRFHVIAASSEGVWNRTGAAITFEIPPTFLQSRWFLAACLILGAALLWLLYRLRMAQVAQRIHVGHEARLGERERIARELHDTLLQSVQGLVLRFQSIANKMPPGDHARDLMESALKRADDVIIDGRNRVRDLRSAENTGDLAAILEERANAACFDPSVLVKVSTEGVPRAAHPLVAGEIGRIAGEALFNTARHARAKSVEIMIGFTRHQLSVRIHDDGVGFPPDVIARGHKPGHFGLMGMRERTQRIGGVLSIDNRPSGGAEISLRLPARLAYVAEAPSWTWLSDILRRFRRSQVG
ncbi:ligand-binding sensor domain-containing protein [Caulobacter radicis]|uniref:ligand-binding sensor domain-containing protein n=1 Tax=Caulobacter radicis TaxID=2172650 RepID=UPI0026D333A1